MDYTDDEGNAPELLKRRAAPAVEWRSKTRRASLRSTIRTGYLQKPNRYTAKFSLTVQSYLQTKIKFST
jgi:hypothetical protein